MKFRRSVVFIVFYILLFINGGDQLFAQRSIPALRDSVRLYLAKASAGKITTPYRSLQFSNRALLFARKAKDSEQAAEARYQICTTLNSSIPYDSLQLICETALAHFEGKQDRLKSAQIRNHLGIIHDVLGEDERAIMYFEKAVEQFRSFNMCKELANAYNNYGVVFLSSRNNEKAKDYYFKALEINEQCPDARNEMISFHNIGAQFLHKKDFKQALIYLHRSEKTARRTNDQFWMSSVFLRLSTLYRHLGDLAKAQKYAGRCAGHCSDQPG